MVVGWIRSVSERDGSGVFENTQHFASPVEKDTEEFRIAMGKWLALVATTERRPRALKRFVNQVRLYAMLAGKQRNRELDPYIVGLSALFAVEGKLKTSLEFNDQAITKLLDEAMEIANAGRGETSPNEVTRQLAILKDEAGAFCSGLESTNYVQMIHTLHSRAGLATREASDESTE